MAARANGSTPDIYIVGLGISGIEHVTREAESAMRKSNEILAIPAQEAVNTYLRGLCPNVTELHGESYREGENRVKAYDTMAARVLDAALDHPPVSFALYGHPLVYVSPSRQIIEASRHLGLTTRTLPGISALDTIIVDMEFDPAVDGLQMYEATDLLLRERPLQPDVPCLIWQVGTVESVLYSTAASKPERFARIKEYLLRFYPPEHEATAVYSTHHPLLESSLTTFRLDEMETKSDKLHQGLTLYIPPVTSRAIANSALLEQLESRDHLSVLTEFVRD